MEGCSRTSSSPVSRPRPLASILTTIWGFIQSTFMRVPTSVKRFVMSNSADGEWWAHNDAGRTENREAEGKALQSPSEPVSQGVLLASRRKYITDSSRRTLTYDRYMGAKPTTGFGILLLLGSALPCPFGRAAAPIPVMLLDGESAGSYHAWRLTTPVLKLELEETGLFQVDVVTAPSFTRRSDRFQA